MLLIESWAIKEKNKQVWCRFTTHASVLECCPSPKLSSTLHSLLCICGWKFRSFAFPNICLYDSERQDAHEPPGAGDPYFSLDGVWSTNSDLNTPNFWWGRWLRNSVHTLPDSIPKKQKTAAVSSNGSRPLNRNAIVRQARFCREDACCESNHLSWNNANFLDGDLWNHKYARSLLTQWTSTIHR